MSKIHIFEGVTFIGTQVRTHKRHPQMYLINQFTLAAFFLWLVKKKCSFLMEKPVYLIRGKCEESIH